jgi:hypothetical protein
MSFFKNLTNLALIILLSLSISLSAIQGIAQTNKVETNKTQTSANTFSDPTACTETKSIKITDIFVTTSFTPLVDGACSVDDSGGAVPLSLAVLPSILLRGYGLMASLIFYFFGINLLVGGLRWIYAGISDDPARQAAGAKQGIFRSVIALGIVLSSYLIVFTILRLLQIDSLANTDISSFFSL